MKIIFIICFMSFLILNAQNCKLKFYYNGKEVTLGKVSVHLISKNKILNVDTIYNLKISDSGTLNINTVLDTTSFIVFKYKSRSFLLDYSTYIKFNKSASINIEKRIISRNRFNLLKSHFGWSSLLKDFFIVKYNHHFELYILKGEKYAILERRAKKTPNG